MLILSVCGLGFSQKKRVLYGVWRYFRTTEAERGNFRPRHLRGAEIVAFTLIILFAEHPMAFLLAPVGLLVLIATPFVRML